MDFTRSTVGTPHAVPPKHDDMVWLGGPILGLCGHPLPGDRVIHVTGKNYTADFDCGHRSVAEVEAFPLPERCKLTYRLV